MQNILVMAVFKIITEPGSALVKQITCREKDLYMRVVPEEREYSADRMIIEVALDDFLDGGKTIVFEVLYPKLDEKFNKWSMNLFMEAATYYCQVELDTEPTGFQFINDLIFMPYNNAGDYVL
jgi:hypothetical protein